MHGTATRHTAANCGWEGLQPLPDTASAQYLMLVYTPFLDKHRTATVVCTMTIAYAYQLCPSTRVVAVDMS